ncbi:tRNA1(Val) (adenine(37)-N6)-methyltransferase [Thalassococcus sp. BH17M4-6]|uniref:tRNA1(Val) (adenine(37)-N6)-methyltransferase n=1 Tax=Thalassococcus sp. BH17M4-6 TaxID=3413148 RepID=UPI003BD02F2D
MRTEPFAEAELTCDDFLGGKLRLWQARDGYRAGVDPVLLAASVPARTGQSVLDLGCGAGAALLSLGARVPGLRLTGIELQPAYADLARRNAAANDLPAEIVTADLTELPTDLKQQRFDHVIANPPYFEPGRRMAAEDAGRETGLAGPTALSDWVAVAARRTDPRGTVTMIQRAARLPELLAAFAAHLHAVQVLPLAPRSGRDPKLVLIRGRKQGRAAFRLHASVILHDSPAHVEDREDYAPQIAAVLRCGAALSFPA